MAYFQIEPAVGSEWRWRLKAENHEIIASGEGYKNLADCRHAVQIIKRDSATATVHEAGVLSATPNALLSMTRPVRGSQTVLSRAMTNALDQPK